MIPLARSFIRYISLYREAVFIFSTVLLFSFVFGSLAYGSFERVVTINDNGSVVIAKTMKYTVNEVLNQKGIEIGPQDDLSVGLDRKIQKRVINDIYIKRAIPIKVFADGMEEEVYTTKDTVFEALSNSKLAFNVYDRVVGAGMTDKVNSGMNLNIVRITSKTVTENKTVAFSTQKRESRELASGEEKTVRHGSEGKRELTFRVLVENGKEIAKQLINECIITAPVDRIVEYGDKYSHRVSRGSIVRYSRVIDVRTTAYTASYEDTGKRPGDYQFGITATGVRVKRGMIAVDPRVIPLGSRVYVEIAGDTPDYGYATATDTGGAIKGNIIDLYFDSQKEVYKWGCRRGKIYILEE
jgi:uncharacterized protein YabE (DUF348 family)